MQISSDTPKRDITIQTAVFTVPQPFKAGDTITEGEAHALNQTLAENLRNNFRDLVDEAVEKGVQEANARAIDSLQAELDEYASSYEFGKRTGGIRATDPVVSAMNELARKIVKKRLKAEGHKLSDYDSATINKYAAEVIERHHDQLKAKAEAAVASEAALLADIG